MNMGMLISFLISVLISLDKFPEMELLDHMIVLFLVFGRSSILFFIVAAPIYIPINSAQEFPFLYILASTFCQTVLSLSIHVFPAWHQTHLIHCYGSVAKLCPTLCNPMDWSMPGFPVLHYLPELAQTHVHWVSDAIQTSHPLLPLFLLPSVFSSIREFSSGLALHIRWPKYWSFSFSISTSSEHSGLISFRIDWFNLPAVQGTLKSLLQHHSLKASVFLALSLLYVPILISYLSFSMMYPAYISGISRVTIYSLDVLLSQFGTSLLFRILFYYFLACFQVSQEAG